MKKLICAALVACCGALVSPAMSQEVLGVIQVHFVCDTREGAKQMAINVFAGHGMRAVGCQDIEDLQWSVVKLIGPLEPVHWNTQVVYVGRVENSFVRGYSAGHVDMLTN